MKKKAVLLFWAVLCAGLLFGCGVGAEDENRTFTGEVIEVYDGSVLVSTSDDVGFDLATVRFADGAAPDFALAEGQILQITILPQIAESYPVQVTAVLVILITDVVNPGNTPENLSSAA